MILNTTRFSSESVDAILLTMIGLKEGQNIIEKVKMADGILHEMETLATNVRANHMNGDPADEIPNVMITDLGIYVCYEVCETKSGPAMLVIAFVDGLSDSHLDIAWHLEEYIVEWSMKNGKFCPTMREPFLGE